jgi:hypothetical protein
MHEIPLSDARLEIRNPFANPRKIREHHQPQGYDHRQDMADSRGRPYGMDEHGIYADGRMDRLLYSASQQPGQFSYTPPSPSQQDANMEYYPPEGHNQYLENDRANDQNGQSHSAEDATQFASL